MSSSQYLSIHIVWWSNPLKYLGQQWFYGQIRLDKNFSQILLKFTVYEHFKVGEILLLKSFI